MLGHSPPCAKHALPPAACAGIFARAPESAAVQEALARLGCGPADVEQRVDALVAQVVANTLEERQAERERARDEARKRQRGSSEIGGRDAAAGADAATLELLG